MWLMRVSWLNFRQVKTVGTGIRHEFQDSQECISRCLSASPVAVSDGYVTVAPRDGGRFIPVLVPSLEEVPLGSLKLEGLI